MFSKNSYCMVADFYRLPPKVWDGPALEVRPLLAMFVIFAPGTPLFNQQFSMETGSAGLCQEIEATLWVLLQNGGPQAVGSKTGLRGFPYNFHLRLCYLYFLSFPVRIYRQFPVRTAWHTGVLKRQGLSQFKHSASIKMPWGQVWWYTPRVTEIGSWRKPELRESWFHLINKTNKQKYIFHPFIWKIL